MNTFTPSMQRVKRVQDTKTNSIPSKPTLYQEKRLQDTTTNSIPSKPTLNRGSTEEEKAYQKKNIPFRPFRLFMHTLGKGMSQEWNRTLNPIGFNQTLPSKTRSQGSMKLCRAGKPTILIQTLPIY